MLTRRPAKGNTFLLLYITVYDSHGDHVPGDFDKRWVITSLLHYKNVGASPGIINCWRIWSDEALVGGPYLKHSGNRARPINTPLTAEEAPVYGDHTLSCCKPWMCPKYKEKRGWNLSFSQPFWEQRRQRKQDPAWFNLQDWSVPVNIPAHAGRVRALLSVCLLHADTIRIAVCVSESHHLLSNTQAGDSRTERCDWGRPGPSGHRALIVKLFFSSIFNRCNTPATAKGLHNRILQ